MAFAVGRNAKVYVNGYDVTAYFGSADLALEQGTYPTAVFGTQAKTYVPGMLAGTFGLEGFFDGGADAIDQILKAALPLATPGTFEFWPDGDTAGKRGFASGSVLAAYAISEPVDDVVSISASFQASGGLLPVSSLKALGAVTSATDHPSVDNGASSAFGGAGTVQATAFTGTSVIVKIQHSTDDAVWVDLITFAAIDAAHDYERQTVAGTVNRYARAQHASGTFSSVTDVIDFARFAS